MKKGISLFYILTLLLLVAQSSLFAGASLEVDPHDVKVQAGSEFTVNINLTSDEDIMSLMAILQWDDSVIEPVEYIVPTEFDDPDNISTGWIEDSTMAIIGVAKMFANAIVAPYNGTIAQIKFKAKADAEVGDSTLVYLSLDSDLYQAADIGVQTVDMDPVQTNLTDGEVTIVKLFNVSDGNYNESDWVKGNSVQVASLSENYLTYTNENGDAYPGGGKVTTIDKANITLKVGGVDVEYSATSYGDFSFSTATETITWNGKVTAATGHDALEFTIPFTAKSNDNKYTDSNTFTLNVQPQNNPPVISDLTVIAREEGAAFSCSVKVVDPDGDAFDLPTEFDAVVGDGEFNLKGTWANDGDVWTFTTNDPIPYDAVTHTASANNVLESVGGQKCYYASWSATLTATDEYGAQGSFEAGSTPNKFNTWIKDKDRVQTAPTFTKYEPAAPTTNDYITAYYGEATDEDGDAIEYTVAWNRTAGGSGKVSGQSVPPSMTKKGDTWQATIIATTKPYGTSIEVQTKVDGPEVTIGNTAPTLTADKTSLFIRKGEATSGTVKFTITDYDEADTFTIANAVGQRGGVTPYEGTVGSEFEVTFNVLNPGIEFTDGSITVKVNDGDDDSNEVTIPVKYVSHQVPEITVDSAPESALDEVVTNDAEVAKKGEADATAFTIRLTAHDPNEEGETGIADIEWTLPEGWSYIEMQPEPVRYTNAPAATTRTFAILVTTAGYETIAGAARAASASADFEIKATVTDVAGATNDQIIPVTINDVDRAPTAPTNMDVVSIGGNKTGSTYKMKAMGSEDPDGDEVSYVYTLYVDGALTETSAAIALGTEFTTTTAMLKGQVAELKATAVSTPPYGGDQVESEEYTTGELDAIENSAPVITTPTEDVKVTIEEYVDSYNEASIALAVGDGESDPVQFAYTDIDEDAEVDNVTLEVNGDGLEGYATIALEGNVITITREPNVNTVDLDTLPTFTITATDESGESVGVVISLEITPVNTKPVVEQADIYVLPSDMDGTEKVVTYQMVRMGDSADEDNTQKIAAVNLISCDWEGFLTAEPEFEISEDGKSFDVKFTMDENAEAGTELEMVIAVQDDGGLPFEDTSDEVTIKFILGSTPWYPIYETDCEEEHEAHQLVITSADGNTTTLIVEGEELRPADYYEQGCKGLEPGDYTVVAYAWTVADGAAAEPCYEGEFTVPEYDVPGLASVAYEEIDSTITVSAPLASSYVLTIYKDGALFKTITKDFIPNEDGLIVPTETFEYVFADAGTYTATIHGVNPKGNGPESEETELIVIEEDEEVELAWPEEGVFTPTGVIYLEDGARSANVSFSWPVVDAAVKYILVILNSATGLNFETTLTANTYTKNLSLSGSKASFNWYVIAVDADGNELSSDAMDFSLVQKTNKAVIEGISVAFDGDDTVIFNLVGFDPEKVKKVDIQIAHIVDKQVTWYYAVKSQGGAADLNAEEDGTATATIDGATISKGDIAVVRFYYTDGSVDKYTTYTVK